MAQDLVIDAEKRSELGKGPARRMRAAGMTPVVVYGHGKAAVPLSVDSGTLESIEQHTGLLSIQVAGRKRPITAIIKDEQRDVTRGHILHMDFQEVRADEVISTTVPIEPHGEPAGAQEGGQLEQAVHELAIRCPANKMPELLEVDVSGMELGDTLAVSDLVLPEDVVSEEDAERTVFSVRIPQLEIEAEEAEAAAEEEALLGEAVEGEEAAEPEVISKGKQEDEEAGEEPAE